LKKVGGGKKKSATNIDGSPHGSTEQLQVPSGSAAATAATPLSGNGPQEELGLESPGSRDKKSKKGTKCWALCVCVVE